MGGEVLQYTKKKGNTPHCLSLNFLFTQFQFFNDCAVAFNVFAF
jgi:hypothetical protein